MTERPILFSGREVRAVLSGQKAQARRIVKPQPAHSCRYEMNGAGDKALHLADGPRGGASHVRKTLYVPVKATSADHRLPCPFGAPGDHLWCRETFALEHLGEDGERVVWKADRAALWLSDGEKPHYLESDYKPARWTPAVQMPRRLSRIMLEVTGVRVQRLQDISEEDAKAEGLKVTGPTVNQAGEVIDDRPGYLGYGSLWHDPRRAFEAIWDSINGKSAPWSSNPWVWVLEFKRVEQEGAKAA